MAIQTDQLGGASNNPGETIGPTMLSVGDSLMWGQGLNPQNRFRELVRRRLSEEGESSVIELSMARSGAVLNPSGLDSHIHGRMTSDEPSVPPIYSPDEFARETPHSSLSTLQQLETAHEILESESNPESDPSDITLILLDGGINDVGIGGIITPFPAYEDGHFISGWNGWLLEKTEELLRTPDTDDEDDPEEGMEHALRTALDRFPNAVIVVNGYFPIFSMYSIAKRFKLKSLGILHAVGSTALPISLGPLSSASETWRVASSKHIREAIEIVVDEHPDRTVLFAPSNIRGSHCLFGPASWLWEYNNFPETVIETPPDEPVDQTELMMFFAGATPEDEVQSERAVQCRRLSEELDFEGVKCRLASIGHPTVRGAQDYADSIITALEDAGEIDSTINNCSQQRRRRNRLCEDRAIDRAFGCLSVEAGIGETCSRTLTPLFEMARERFEQAGEHLQQAGTHISGVPGCFADTADNLQECDSQHGSEVADCNASFSQQVATTCDIQCTSFTDCNTQCTSFTNCNQFGSLDPRRYTCRAARTGCVAAAAVARAACQTARATCVAAATTARTACIAGATAVREACKAVALAKNLACKATTVGSDIGCAASQVVQTGISLAAAVFNGTVGAVIGGVAGAGVLGCGFVRRIVNRGCSIVNSGLERACRIGSAVLSIPCRVGTLVGRFSNIRISSTNQNRHTVLRRQSDRP